jgi:hypothetical protein
MKIKKETLKRIIKEEYDAMQSEVRYGGAYDSEGEYTGDPAMSDDSEEIGRLQKKLMGAIRAAEEAGHGDKLQFAKKFVKDPVDYSGPAALADLSDMIAYVLRLK